MSHRTRIRVIVIIAILAIAGIVAIVWRKGDPSRMSPDPQQRSQAAVQPSMLPGKDSIPGLRKLLAESEEAEILVPVICGLTSAEDIESMPLLLARMEHRDPRVSDLAGGHDNSG